MKRNSLLWIGGMAVALTAALHAQQPKAATPADGYTVHVSAPHVVNGKVMGPFHHYCKVMSPDPVIVCQIYDSTDANATTGTGYGTTISRRLPPAASRSMTCLPTKPRR